MNQDSRRERKAIVQRLESLGRAGVSHLPKTGRRGSPKKATGQPAAKQTDERSVAVEPAAGETRPATTDREGALTTLCGEVAACQRCPVLVNHRTQTVFGVGDIRSRLVFFGEAPGADEDIQGEPFVGRSGQLLDKMIEAMTLKRSGVYIMNVLKCRPPDNRTPEPEEVENCRPFFERQLEILRPEFICCLGAVATRALLKTTPQTSLGSLRGRVHRWGESQVVVTYHPSYLLRNPPAKGDAWKDLQFLMKLMGLSLPGG